jgi:hypothetical protein
MVKAVLLYGPPEDPNAFGRRCRVCRIRSRSGHRHAGRQRCALQCIAELAFADMDALRAGLGSDGGQAAVNDIPSFGTRSFQAPRGAVTHKQRRSHLVSKLTHCR